jgi:hypothetical protein
MASSKADHHMLRRGGETAKPHSLNSRRAYELAQAPSTGVREA